MDPWYGQLPNPVGDDITVRVASDVWSRVVEEVFDFRTRERAGALLVRGYPSHEPQLLVGLEWMPVPDRDVRPSEHGLAFDGRFNLRVAERAELLRSGALLVHAHPGIRPPIPSRTDAEEGAAFMAFMQRRLPHATSGLLVVADHTITGIVGIAADTRKIARVLSAGIPTRAWSSIPSVAPPANSDRQLLAIGAGAQQQLETATIAVIGNSGGGSHVTQQLIHAGVGTLIVIDPDTVEDTNLRRLVGATQADVDAATPKPDIAVRIAAAVRDAVNVVPIREAFPSTTTIAALRHADIIIGCVDGWDTRDDLNTYALRHRIPYLDVGIIVTSACETTGMRVSGQIVLVTPDGPCLRCMRIVTDQRVQASRERRQGYAEQEPDPQVVSINGSVASEAVTTALMLLAGDDRLSRRRRYAYPPGLITEVTAVRQSTCRACRDAGLELPQEPVLAQGSSSTQEQSRRRRATDWLSAITKRK